MSLDVDPHAVVTLNKQDSASANGLGRHGLVPGGTEHVRERERERERMCSNP